MMSVAIEVVTEHVEALEATSDGFEWIQTATELAFGVSKKKHRVDSKADEQ